jgi:NTE family protein
LKDATKILVQISNLQMLEAMKEKIKKTDIYIKPDIKNYTVISFNEGAAIIKKGEEATNLFLNNFKNYLQIIKNHH